MLTAFCLILLSSNCGSGQQTPDEPGPVGFSPAQKAHIAARQQWVQSAMDSMSLEQKIGQLYMVAAYSNKLEAHAAEVERLIRDFHIGGLIFMQGGPIRQAQLTNRFQAAAKVPLMIAMDAEWGLGMRLKDSTMSFPRQMTLGAIRNDALIEEMGAEVARQCRRLGVHVNFAPVVDVNSNPKNPVIGVRSFGENRERVAQKGIAYTRGMQQNGVLACAKHFPGHGDTDTDSHLTLPVLNHSRSRLDSMELYPFRRLIADSVGSVMVAHLHIPAYDSAENRPTTLSPAVVQGLLIDSLGFEGLIFTDALNMKGVANYYDQGEADLKALLAGNTVLLFAGNIEKGIQTIRKAIVEDSLLTEQYLDERVRKILTAKYELKLHEEGRIEVAGLHEDLHSNRAKALKSRLYEQAVTVVRNKEYLLPIKNVDSVSFAYLSIGQGYENGFKQIIRKYAPFDFYQIPAKAASNSQYDGIYEKLKTKDVVFVTLHDLSRSASRGYGIHPNTIRFLRKLQADTKVVVTVFGVPYSLSQLAFLDYLVCGYEDDPLAHQAVPQVLFGAVKAHGTLPVTVTPDLPEGAGFEMASLGRLGFGLPEMVGIASAELVEIDSICQQAIRASATPGCQVLVAKDGRVILERGYGYHTYTQYRAVTDQTVYDLASLTKALATTQAIMFLDQDGRISLDDQAGQHLAELATTNKGRMKISALLTHQAGLKAWLPLVDRFRIGKAMDTTLFRYQPETGFPVEVSKGLYASAEVPELTWQEIAQSSLTRKRNRYRRFGYWYSDLGFLMLQRIVEKVAGQPLDKLLEERLYRPLGLTSLGFHPLERISKDSIPPTEMDVYFRLGLVHGTVHDPSAALLGGVGGNAGLFGHAFDIAVLMQLHLQQGYYGGRQYFRPKLVTHYNRRPYRYNDNRRGLGWDKPVIRGNGGPTSDYAPTETFGHTGFTGTCAWADPKNNLIYIFLSNRIYPYAENKRLLRDDVRTRIQTVIYKAIGMTRPIRR